MNDFHTGLFDCCKSEYTLNNGRVVKFSRLESLKAFICPCIVLEENTRRLNLEPKSIYCQNWNCLGFCLRVSWRSSVMMVYIWPTMSRLVQRHFMHQSVML